MAEQFPARRTNDVWFTARRRHRCPKFAEPLFTAPGGCSNAAELSRLREDPPPSLIHICPEPCRRPFNRCLQAPAKSRLSLRPVLLTAPSSVSSCPKHVQLVIVVTNRTCRADVMGTAKVVAAPVRNKRPHRLPLRPLFAGCVIFPKIDALARSRFEGRARAGYPP